MMPSEAHKQIAHQIRVNAARGRFHGPAFEPVKMFGLDFTAEAVSEVEAALSYEGLASQPRLSPDMPKTEIRVAIVGGSSAHAFIQVEDIEILAGEPGRPYRAVGSLKARVTAPTNFSKTPTIEDVNFKLREQAVAVGANAVMNVRYSSYVSITWRKVLTAYGTAVAVDLAADGAPGVTPNAAVDPVERIHQLAQLLASGAITQGEYEDAKQRLLGEI
jgi:hypothetical protein